MVIPPLHSGCLSCRGTCCRTYLVHVNGRDAVRIARVERLELDAFLQLAPEAPPPGSGFMLDDGATAYSLALRRRPDAACTFLVGGADGAERCGIYSQRPLACALFPLRLVGDVIGIKPDVTCEPSGRRIVEDELPQARALFGSATADWNVYALVVATWNELRAAAAQRADARAYFAYLVAAYDAIDAALAVRGETRPIEQTVAAALAPVVLRALGE